QHRTQAGDDAGLVQGQQPADPRRRPHRRQGGEVAPPVGGGEPGGDRGGAERGPAGGGHEQQQHRSAGEGDRPGRHVAGGADLRQRGEERVLLGLGGHPLGGEEQRPQLGHQPGGTGGLRRDDHAVPRAAGGQQVSGYGQRVGVARAGVLGQLAEYHLTVDEQARSGRDRTALAQHRRGGRAVGRLRVGERGQRRLVGDDDVAERL